MQKHNLTQKELADRIPCSVGVINKFLQGNEIGFDIALKLVRYLLPEQEEELMKVYCEEVTNKNMRLAFEYCSTHKLYDTFEALLKIGENDQNKKVREWAYIYSIMYYGQKNANKEKKDNFLRIIRGLNPSDFEMSVFVIIMEMLGHNIRNEYSTVYSVAYEVLKKSKGIENQFMKTSYEARIYEILARLELIYNNNPIKSLEYSKKVIDYNIGKQFTANSYFNYGLSHLFTNPNECIENIKRSMVLFRELGMLNVVESLQEQIEIIQIYYDLQVEPTRDFTKALYQVKYHQADHSLLEPFKKDKFDLAFILLIQGMNKNNKELLQYSFQVFLMNKDTFRTRFALNELQKLNYDVTSLTHLLSVNKLEA